MKQLLIDYANYDYWANKQMLDLVLSLTKAQQQQTIQSSFPSIHKTCSHMWDAYRIWWQRLQKDADIMGPTVNADYSLQQVVENILNCNKQWIDWVTSASQVQLDSNLDFKTMKGDSFSQPMSDILLHLSNHGTYHRGQLVTMLRQVGVEKISQTDYILYARG